MELLATLILGKVDFREKRAKEKAQEHIYTEKNPIRENWKPHYISKRPLKIDKTDKPL